MRLSKNGIWLTSVFRYVVLRAKYVICTQIKLEACLLSLIILKCKSKKLDAWYGGTQTSIKTSVINGHNDKNEQHFFFVQLKKRYGSVLTFILVIFSLQVLSNNTVKFKTFNLYKGWILVEIKNCIVSITVATESYRNLFEKFHLGRFLRGVCLNKKIPKIFAFYIAYRQIA